MVQIKLGMVTDTWDVSGRMIAQKENPSCALSEIEKNIALLKGTQYQTPPMYSAIKYKGRPLYAYAREGKTVPVKKRKITIYDIELLQYTASMISLSLVCSSGTYIRWVAHILGQRLGCGAAVKMLTRTRIGNHSLANAVCSADIDRTAKESVIGLEEALPEAGTIMVYEQYEKRILNGHWVSMEMIDAEKSCMHTPEPGAMIYVRGQDQKLLAIHKIEQKTGAGISKPMVIMD